MRSLSESYMAPTPTLTWVLMRRTCARLCHLAGGELEQIQFLLGHASVQTTEHYYVQKVDMCSGCPKSPIVNARAWLDSA
jgi:hypothetical protein